MWQNKKQTEREVERGRDEGLETKKNADRERV